MSAASNKLARAALGYAARGLLVHPVRPDRKEPILNAWQKLATLDRQQIAKWWQQRPNANVAVACGGPARLLVVDVDPDAGGEASMRTLEAEHGTLPTTAAVVTPRGGRHLYYLVRINCPMPGNSASKLGAGIDTRGRSGYVCAPPSTVLGRPYCWSVDSGDQIAHAPDWLLGLLATRGGNGQGATPPEEWLQLVTKDIGRGVRNHTIARLAGLLFRRLPDPEVAAELITCFNTVKCRPPLEAAELKTILDSIAASEMRRRGLAS